MLRWLLLLGCRDDDGLPLLPEPPLPLYASGDRLEARIEVFGTAERLVTFHDTELGVDCAFETLPGPDGRVRCVPDGPVLAEGFFADEACTEPVVTEAAPGELVHDVPADTCAAETGWYTAADVADRVYAREGGVGDCVVVPDVAGVRLDPFDGDSFVAADLVVEPRGPVDAWVARADDGAWQIQSGWSEGLGSPVGQFGYGFGRTGAVWWPRLFVAYVYNLTFADSTCTAPVAQKFPADAACPVLFGVTFDPSEAPLYRTGPQLDPATLWAVDEGTGGCVDAGLAGSTDLFFGVEAEVDDDELEPIVEDQVGFGRVRRRLLGSEDGEPVMLADPPFWDDELDAPCSSRALVGDRSYCLPPPIVSFAYADAECTELLAELPDSAADWGAVSITYDDVGLQVRELGEVVRRVWIVTFASGSAECVHPEPEDKVGLVYRRVGDAVPTSGLVPGFP